MNKEEIIEMGMQAGISKPVLLLGNNLKLLTAFAKLVEEHEREACAKICDDMDSISDYYTLRVELICAQAIRARGQE
jgi:hypothetical protein